MTIKIFKYEKTSGWYQEEQIKDRTLTLTHQQFQLLQDALNIAELTCNDMFKMANIKKFKSEADKSAAGFTILKKAIRFMILLRT